MRVLLVEDSPVLRDSLAQGLREAGYAVDTADDGKQGFLHACTTDYDVVILDWMLPGLDGLSVLQRLRARGVSSGVLMLTARDAVDDRVAGLTAGADDYLVKPFAFRELLARIGGLARRRHGKPSPLLRVGPLEIDTSAKVVRVCRIGAPAAGLSLTPREFALLEYLAIRSGRPVPRTELEEHLYDDRSQVFSNAIDSAVAALRAKLEAASCPGMIHTRRKVGYLLAEAGP